MFLCNYNYICRNTLEWPPRDFLKRRTIGLERLVNRTTREWFAFMRTTVKATVITYHVRNPACTITRSLWETRNVNGLSAHNAYTYGAIQIHFIIIIIIIIIIIVVVVVVVVVVSESKF